MPPSLQRDLHPSAFPLPQCPYPALYFSISFTTISHIYLPCLLSVFSKECNLHKDRAPGVCVCMCLSGCVCRAPLPPGSFLSTKIGLEPELRLLWLTFALNSAPGGHVQKPVVQDIFVFVPELKIKTVLNGSSVPGMGQSSESHHVVYAHQVCALESQL